MPEEEMKKRFPHLAKEMEAAPPSPGQNLKVKVNPTGYQPNVFDFLARCDNHSQAMEIVNYLEKRGELSESEAGALRKRIAEKGVRSLAKKRQPGHYFREFSE